MSDEPRRVLRAVSYGTVFFIVFNALLSSYPGVPAVAPVAGSPSTVLSVQPQVVIAALGSEFTVEVRVTDAPYLCGYDFKLLYDTSILTVTSASLVGTVFDGMPNFPIKTDVFEGLGEVRYAVTLLGVPPDPIVSGKLLTVTMRVDQLGPTTLDLTNDILVSCVDGSTFAIPHDTLDGVIPTLSQVSMRSVECRADNLGFNINAHGTVQTVWCRVENNGLEPAMVRVQFDYQSVGGNSGSSSSPAVTLAPGQQMQLEAQITVPVQFDVYLVRATLIRITPPVGDIAGESSFFKFNVRVCTSGECL